MKSKLQKGFTLIELIVSVSVFAIVTGVVVGTALTVLNNQDQQKYREDANGVIDAYHTWYTKNIVVNRTNTAEESLYNFITDESGLESFDYNKLNFNYYFEDSPIKDENGFSHYYAYLLFNPSDYACSIPLEVSKASIYSEKGHLTFSENTTPTLYKNYVDCLEQIGKDENSLSLGVYNNVIGRKVSKINVLHTIDNHIENLFVRNGHKIETTVFDETFYTLNGISGNVILSQNGNDIPSPRDLIFDVKGFPKGVLNSAKVEGVSKNSTVIVYGDDTDYEFDDASLPNVANTGCVVRYNVNYTKKIYTYTQTRTRTDRFIHCGSPIYNLAEFNYSNRTTGSFSPWSDISSSSEVEEMISTKNIIKSFDTLESANKFIYSSYYTNPETLVNYDIYSTFETAQGNQLNYNETSGYDGYDYVKLSWYDGYIYDRFYKETKTWQKESYNVSFDHDSFAIFIGTTTLDKDYKVPTDFDFILDYSFKNITSSTISDQNASIKDLYLRDYKNNVYTTHKLYNSLTINNGVTLDLTDSGYFKVGGLMLPSDDTNNKDNVTAYSEVVNNGTMIVNQLEVLGYISGNGKIETSAASDVWERGAILDYVGDGQFAANIDCSSIGAGTGAGQNTEYQEWFTMTDFSTKVGGWSTSCNKLYGSPMFSKYDFSAISCNLDLVKDANYTIKFFFDLSEHGNNNNDYLQWIDFSYFGRGFNLSNLPHKSENDNKAGALFNISNDGVITKSVVDNKMRFTTNDASVYFANEYRFVVTFGALDNNTAGWYGNIIVSSLYCPLSIYNTAFVFDGTSSLNLSGANNRRNNKDIRGLKIELRPTASIYMGENTSFAIDQYTQLVCMNPIDFNAFYKDSPYESLGYFNGEKSGSLIIKSENVSYFGKIYGSFYAKNPSAFYGVSGSYKYCLSKLQYIGSGKDTYETYENRASLKSNPLNLY